MSDNPMEPMPPVRLNQQRPTFAVDGDTMERLFQALFYRIAVLYARTIPKHIRRLGESAILVMAISCLALVVYLHIVFNQQPISCLSYLHNNWPRQGVLRIELFFEAPPEDYDLQQSYAKEFQQLSTKQNYSIPPISEHSNESKEIYSNMSIKSSLLTEIDEKFFENETAQLIDVNSASDTRPNDSLLDTFYHYVFDYNWLKELLDEEHYILEYSLEYGFLRLSPTTRQRLNVEVLLVTLDMTNNTCFGSGLNRFILDQFLGYQEILMSSIKQLAEKETHKGYVRNVMTNEHFRFVSSWQNRRWWSYLATLCIMILFTISISMLLRYSHFQIFLFIVDLLRMIEHNTSIIFPAAPLLTVILALIGMEAIMSEFFNDASTAFYIILVVWVSDQYDSICCHTSISKRHWVRFFYIYHFAFYVYHTRYNGQYSGLALITSCCFILHSMLYFFHHYELPVIETQLAHVVIEQNNLTQATERNDDETLAAT
ncbi:unnamed protein product [Adineta ricciae]|uniref:Membralin n=1 Tax=Adineta ricciae TaxID=249248 RepID=A0A813SEG1_ADIRI|nr:unnamed protein product [Adineta ricciae]CAF1032599.1 unnamed protein product [Adineta ricciae]